MDMGKDSGIDTLKIFEGVHIGSVDFSPFQPQTVIKMIIEDEELATASEQRIERFWRVWYKERHAYAPKLERLILGLLVGDGDGDGDDHGSGIMRFVEFFETRVYGRAANCGLEVYVINKEVVTKILEIQQPTVLSL